MPSEYLVITFGGLAPKIFLERERRGKAAASHRAAKPWQEVETSEIGQCAVLTEHCPERVRESQGRMIWFQKVIVINSPDRRKYRLRK